MQVDSCFFKACGKDVCQDYAMSWLHPFPAVVISDGCSSSPRTDVGARIVSLSARKVLSESRKEIVENSDILGKKIISDAWLIAQQLNLAQNALDATCGVILKHRKHIQIFFWGDGLVVVKEKGKDFPFYGKLSYYRHDDRPIEMPYYLSYHLDRKRKDQYAELNHDGYLAINGSQKIIPIEPYDLSLNILDLNISHSEWAIIASDGTFSFQKDSEPYDALPELFDFTNFVGSFLSRQIKFVLRDFEKRGITWYDDLSFGGIYIGENNES